MSIEPSKTLTRQPGVVDLRAYLITKSRTAVIKDEDREYFRQRVQAIFDLQAKQAEKLGGYLPKQTEKT